MTDPERGLSAAEVSERETRGQVNVVPTSHTRTVGQIVRANVFTRFNALLGGMLAVILVVGPVRDALFGFVLVSNAAVGVWQELRAKRTLDRLSVLTAPKAHVVRDGNVLEIPTDHVVIDDILELVPGGQIVVDGEVVVTDGLELDESLLTGESESVVKVLGERALSGSFVAAGSGRMVATTIGLDTYAVKLALEARRFTLTRSELQVGIDRILRWVTFAIVPTATLLFVSQLRHQSTWRPAVAGAVAGTVAMVPEGLVLLMTVAFAVAVRRLAKRNVLLQEMPAVEGLARVDVLCIDKTG
ncbi:MAG: HAD-IC family P-type ATPase, partial [Actinomycetota bacterium]